MELIKSCLAQFNPRTCVVDSPEWYRCAKHPATVVGGAMLHSLRPGHPGSGRLSGGDPPDVTPVLVVVIVVTPPRLVSPLPP